MICAKNLSHFVWFESSQLFQICSIFESSFFEKTTTRYVVKFSYLHRNDNQIEKILQTNFHVEKNDFLSICSKSHLKCSVENLCFQFWTFCQCFSQIQKRQRFREFLQSQINVASFISKFWFHEFFIVDDVTYDTWQIVYENCHFNHVDFHDRDFFEKHRFFAFDDFDMKSLTFNEKNRFSNEIHEKRFVLRKFAHDENEIDVKTMFDRRFENLQHDWFRKSYDIDVHAIFERIKIFRKNHDFVIDVLSINFDETNNSNTLNVKQREIFDILTRAYIWKLVEQLLIHLNEIAKTNKSRVIDMISKHLIYQFVFIEKHDSKNIIIKTTFTDVTTHNIENSTLHSLFKLLIQTKKMIELNVERLTQLQKYFEFYWLLIIDEKFMMKCRFLSRFLFDNTFYQTLVFSVLTTTSSIINSTRNLCNFMLHK